MGDNLTRPYSFIPNGVKNLKRFFTPVKMIEKRNL